MCGINWFVNVLQGKIDRLQGADLAGLEAKIQQHIGAASEDSGEDFGQGLVCSKFQLNSLNIEILINFIFSQNDNHNSLDGFECFHNKKSMRMLKRIG